MALAQTTIVVKGIKKVYKKVLMLYKDREQESGRVRHSSDDKPVIEAN